MDYLISGGDILYLYSLALIHSDVTNTMDKFKVRLKLNFYFVGEKEIEAS